MITLEDILEEFIGDIQDEYDRLPVHAVPSGWAWVVGGGLSLARLKELSGIDLVCDPPQTQPENGLRNVSDWVIGHLQQPLHGGEVVERPGVRVVVRKVRRQKVLEAQIAQNESTPARRLVTRTVGDAPVGDAPPAFSPQSDTAL